MLRYSDISVERNFRLIDESVENFTTECDSMISSFDDRCNKALNSGFAFEAVEELDFYEEGVKEVIEDIGKKVIELFEKLINAAKELIGNIQTKIFSKKNNLEKVEAVLKKHPEFGKEISVALEKDGLGVTEWKNIKDAEESISKILEDYAKGKIGKEDAEAKKDKELQRLKTKMDIRNSQLKFLTVAGGITVTAALVFFGGKFFKDFMKSENELKVVQKEYEEDMRRAVKFAHDMNKAGVLDTNDKGQLVDNHNHKIYHIDDNGEKVFVKNSEPLNVDRRYTNTQRMSIAWLSEMIKISNQNLSGFSKICAKCHAAITAFSKRNKLYADDVENVYNDLRAAEKFNTGMKNPKRATMSGRTPVTIDKSIEKVDNDPLHPLKTPKGKK